MSDRTPSWGISPVPERLRTLGGLENGMLWSSFGFSLLVLVAGAFLVPALSLPEALLAILVGALFGYVLLGGAAEIRRERPRPERHPDPRVDDLRGDRPRHGRAGPRARAALGLEAGGRRRGDHPRARR